jgi:hypothetical protein
MVYFYRYNTFTKRYYVDEVDAQTYLHDNDVTPILPDDRCECGYCGHVFPSRNALFRHLGAMNIDIRKYRSRRVYECYDYDLGDEGFFFKIRFARKIARANKTKHRDDFLRITSRISKLSVR